MGLLTIGEFAKASGLSPKALRLYGELGLLAPARVDPVTGYRLYAPEQLEQARLVAWLRRLGMPLARIREVNALDGAAAAREVRAFWAGVENDVAARRGMAACLIDHLSGRNATVPNNESPLGSLGLRYAALSDAGLRRATNQDAAYAGSRLLAVADGFGPRGGPASAAAVGALRRLEGEAVADRRPSGPAAEGDEGSPGLSAAALLNVLDECVREAGAAVDAVTGERHSDEGGAGGAGDAAEAGTTLTAMLWTGSRLALVHIGDSRAYLLRDGGFRQITHDHTLVQAMVDEGRITADEAESHPQRALLARALVGRGEGAGRQDAGPDLRLRDARAGDRYLLCSDGLSSVVAAGRIRQTLEEGAEPEETVRRLVSLARESGGPDNVSCVVADVVGLAA